MSNSVNYLISTDLDGTLLDHFTYSWSEARPAITRAKELNVAIVFNTSKTAPEVHSLQRKMDLSAPFIVENGSAIWLPKTTLLSDAKPSFDRSDYSVHLLGAMREDIVSTLVELREQFNFQFESYSDWNIDDLIKHTGLDTATAELSMQRQYSEPLLWHDTPENYQRFVKLINEKGLKILVGGRFIHVLGQSDKGRALLEFKSLFSKVNDKAYRVIALGDSDNDIEMLSVADKAIWVRSPTRKFPDMTMHRSVHYTEEFGPLGWNSAVLNILSDQ